MGHRIWDEGMKRYIWYDDEAESLLDAVSKKNKKAIKRWEEASKSGDLVRIM